MLLPKAIKIRDITIIGSSSYNAELRTIFEQIKDRKILVTNVPSLEILDTGYMHKVHHRSGNEELKRLVKEYKPEIHIFTHAHTDGQRSLFYNNTIFVNVAHLSRRSKDDP